MYLHNRNAHARINACYYFLRFSQSALFCLLQHHISLITEFDVLGWCSFYVTKCQIYAWYVMYVFKLHCLRMYAHVKNQNKKISHEKKLCSALHKYIE